MDDVDLNKRLILIYIFIAIIAVFLALIISLYIYDKCKRRGQPDLNILSQKVSSLQTQFALMRHNLDTDLAREDMASDMSLLRKYSN